MNRDGLAALLSLFDETAALFHRLRKLAEEVHGEGDSSAGRRSILRGLDRLGPQTVPQLARARTVSRQRIQVLVNAMLEDGLLAADPNPAHRKSPLLRLTSLGRRCLKGMQEREAELLANAPTGIPPRDIERAAETLRKLRAFLERADWRRDAGNL
jgi:DNA-binding MarR family transcriptional regulator